MDRKDLECRLENWAAEYGGGRYQDIGYASRNILQTLIEHEGFVPNSGGFAPVPINTQADEVEAAVRQMEVIGYLRPGRVIRCEYFMARAPMEAKLRNLDRVGISIKRPTYYDYLAIAKAFVHAQLVQEKAA